MNTKKIVCAVAYVGLVVSTFIVAASGPMMFRLSHSAIQDNEE